MKKVMVVDDDANLRRTIGVVLRRGGCDVILSPNGADCLQQLRAGFKGVILLDVMMPGLTGWDTIRAMVAENLTHGVLVCMLTAVCAPGNEGEGLEAVVFDYLPKPFGNDVLVRCVENASNCLES